MRPADADDREAADGTLARYDDRRNAVQQYQEQRMQYQQPTVVQSMKTYFFAGIGMTLAFTMVGGIAKMIF